MDDDHLLAYDSTCAFGADLKAISRKIEHSVKHELSKRYDWLFSPHLNPNFNFLRDRILLIVAENILDRLSDGDGEKVRRNAARILSMLTNIAIESHKKGIEKSKFWEKSSG